LLAFSRQQVISPRPIDLNKIICELEPMLRRLIGEDVLLSTSFTPDLGIVRVDPGQVEQVVMNLAVNARDAMPRGGRLSIATSRLEIAEASGRTRAGMLPGSYACITVADTGSGMTPEVKARVFDPFFTTKDPGKGTGLGMAVVHGIVTQSNGYVELESEPGAGTRFSIYFPLVDARLEVAEMEDARAAELPQGSGTILLAEDEDALRNLLGQVLVECGYRVLQARDGKDALQLAQSHEGPIHLLVSDVVMPHLAGRELAERLQALRSEMKVLFLSGYTDDAVVRHGVLQAEFAFLQKPFSPVVFARAVRELLDQP
jgi:CheY-like chemotaxis protein